MVYLPSPLARALVYHDALYFSAHCVCSDWLRIPHSKLIPNCLLDISIWISNRNLKINMTKIEFPFPAFLSNTWQTVLYHLKCTIWWFDLCFEIFNTIKLINTSVTSHSYLLCTSVGKMLKFTLLSNFKCRSVQPVAWGPHVAHNGYVTQHKIVNVLKTLWDIFCDYVSQCI